MGFVDTAEVARWSKIQIDADKDMLGFGLTNLKELALMMQVGDMLAFNAKTNQLAIISPGVASSELITRGNVWPPVWGYPDSGQIPTVQDLTVSTGSDDSSGFTGNYSNAAVNQVLGNSGGKHYNNAFRFLNVNIPATAMVT